MNITFVFILAGIIAIGGLMLFIILRSEKHKPLNVENYRVRCLANEQLLKKGEKSSYHLTIINADKLVDQALRESGIKGQTMGERLRNSGERFCDLNGIWGAHKLRNRIAHEPDATISYDEARWALSKYRKALKDLGAI
ncbi:hypothetical protein HGB24_02190 [Candidatus Saccharibacteria bacterium]|nr:hypothetical protein [Candidatus Saccharibacteria bacterium]